MGILVGIPCYIPCLIKVSTKNLTKKVFVLAVQHLTNSKTNFSNFSMPHAIHPPNLYRMTNVSLNFFIRKKKLKRFTFLKFCEKQKKLTLSSFTTS